MTAPIDFGAVFYSHSACGVKLSYTEYPFMQFGDNKIVLFDAYSATHKYEPLDIDGGVLGFPFCLGCMTDDGERVAYCGVRFSEEKAVEWKPIIKKEVLGLLAVKADAASVSVPSGVCCIADAEGYGEYYSHIKDDIHPLDGHIVLNGQTHTMVEPYGKKIAVFSTGWGDGAYRCYAGRDEHGTVVAVILDCGMIDYGAPPDETLVEIEVDAGDDTYVYDPQKTESENNIDRWTYELGRARTDAARVNAYSRRGYAYHLAHDHDAALSDYMSAVKYCKKLESGNELHRAWFVYDNAADILCARNDYETAIKLMNDALDVNDNFYAGAYVRLIELYRLTRREDKALETAEKMKQKRPDDPVAYIKYAECCVAVTDYARAAEAFDKLATEFWLYENLFDEASCLIALGEHEKASAVLDRHPAKEQYEQYWYYKAYIDFKERRFRAALENAEVSHEIDAEYMPALYLLIDTESALQEYHAVARYAEEYKKLRPDNEYGYSVCAEAQLMLGNFSECARNYLYLYEHINKSEKYAALASVVCGVTGEKKRSSALLRMLKRRRSPYYLGALYCAYISKSREIENTLDKIVAQLRGDGEFLLLIAVYLIHTNNIVSASRILGELGKDKSFTNELVAVQIRLADRIGDKKQFFNFLDYYIEHVFAGNIIEDERKQLAERFMHSPQAHSTWLC